MFVGDEKNQENFDRKQFLKLLETLAADLKLETSFKGFSND